MKTEILWLSRDERYIGYELWKSKPNFTGGVWVACLAKRFFNFCPSLFDKVCPSLKLEEGTCIKVKLTNLKNGIKLEKVKNGKKVKEKKVNRKTG